VADKIAEIFQSAGLRAARQRYEYITSGQKTTGQNVYSVLPAPRGDATEAIVLVAAWRNAAGELNRSGVALLLTLARYFKRMPAFHHAADCSFFLVLFWL
jgi:glycosylphosphatidylinositol transamidase